MSLRQRILRLERPWRLPLVCPLTREPGESRADFERRCEEARRQHPRALVMVFDIGGEDSTAHVQPGE